MKIEKDDEERIKANRDELDAWLESEGYEYEEGLVGSIYRNKIREVD